jgi:RTX calcium-binding nonapeptide repeat (4 copies)
VLTATAICLAGVGAGATSGAGGDTGSEGGGPVEPHLQPLVTHPAPDGTRRFRDGELRVKPTAIVAGAEDQDIRITFDPSGTGGTTRVGVRLYRPADPSAGRGIPRYDGPKRSFRLTGGSPQSLILRDLNLPPGDYRLRLRDPAGERIGGASIVVYAQHRLPPASSGTPAGDGAKTGARALPSPSTNNNISEQAGQQAETYDVVEPDNSARVAASVNPDSGNPNVWVSNDSMRPGTELIQTMPSNSLRRASEGGGTLALDLCCDPALAADDRGNIWLSHLAASPPANYIAINRIAGPSATTLQTNNVAIPRFTTGPQDKPMSFIDTWPTSPKRYRLYEVWIENPGQAVVINECNAATASACDSPENWADTPAAVELGSGTNSYPSVATAPNGDVYVVWWDQDADSIMLDRCLAAENCNLDGSWNEATAIDNDLDPGSVSPLPFFCPIISAPGGRVGPQSYVEVGPDGRVYVAYSELRNNGTNRCNASSNNRTFESRIAAGAPNTFPALNSGVRVTDDLANATNDHFFPTLAADPSVPGRVETSLYSTKLDGTRETTNQFYVTSTDGGASYGAMTQFSTASSDFSGANSDDFDYGDYAGADAAGGLFRPSWTDNRAAHGGDAELYMLTPPSTGPAPPTITDTDPDSPANDNNPEVKGTVGAGSPTQVKIYKNETCLGAPDATGTVAQFTGAGITVNVPGDATTALSARAADAANDESICSNTINYTEDSTAPAAPTITDTDPNSPANDNNPEVKGLAEAGSTVTLFESGSCGGAIEAQGTAASFATPGLTAAVQSNAPTMFTATATDAAGNVSGCSAPFPYVEDSTAPAAPTITDTDPNSPANDNNPEVKGLAEAGSTVMLFESGDCGGAIEAQGTAASFATPGLTAAVADNVTAAFTAAAADAASNVSGCSAPFLYAEVTPPSLLPPTSAIPVFCNGRAATAGTSGANALTGTPGSDALAGLGGKDTLRGRGGKDFLCGGGGKDRLIGGGGNDVCVGGSGQDTAKGCEKRKSI